MPILLPCANVVLFGNFSNSAKQKRTSRTPYGAWLQTHVNAGHLWFRRQLKSNRKCRLYYARVAIGISSTLNRLVRIRKPKVTYCFAVEPTLRLLGG